MFFCLKSWLLTVSWNVGQLNDEPFFLTFRILVSNQTVNLQSEILLNSTHFLNVKVWFYRVLLMKPVQNVHSSFKAVFALLNFCSHFVSHRPMHIKEKNIFKIHKNRRKIFAEPSHLYRVSSQGTIVLFFVFLELEFDAVVKHKNINWIMHLLWLQWLSLSRAHDIRWVLIS